ncbi:MAG: hypothetical protein BMS9Abin37_2015 [Acidobacteriota bacterium]|nr:MAG: hypothetical protein BMS9Abin37_2015 [Acidobacteriota bacterium]
MKRLVFLFVVAAVASAIGTEAQPQGGVLRVSLVNGTTGEAGSAESVTLLRLGGDMTPVKELGAVSGRFEITDFEIEGERPMLLQVTTSGVNYNQPVNFFRGYEADVEVTVYDAFDTWDDATIEITTSRFLYRRENDKLLVDKVYVVENRTSPPRTYHDPNGTFRFNLPTENLLELHSVSASSALGVPVPQQASPLPGGGGYVTKTTFKPGETEIAVSYEVRYANSEYEVVGQAFHRLRELLVFVAPPDIDVTAKGWEILGVEPEGRFTVIRMRDVAAGNPIRFTLSGGSEQAGPLVPSSGGSESSQAQPSAASQGTITRIPDTTRASKWVLIVLMAAALGYGLLATLYPSSSPSRAKRG